MVPDSHFGNLLASLAPSHSSCFSVTLTLASFSSAFSLSTCFLPFHSSAHFLPSLVSLSLPFWSGDLRCFRRPLAAQCLVAKTYKNSQVGPLVIFTLARYAASGTFTPCPTNKCSRGSSVVGLVNNKMDDALRETMTWSSAPRARWTITIRWMVTSLPLLICRIV